MIRAVIFDFDGTIGNTLPLCIAAFRRAIEPLAGKQLPDEEIVATFGPSEEGTIRILAPHAYEQGLADYLNCYRELHDMCPSPFDGIPELLEWLRARGIIIALVTGKGRRSCSISLEQYGIARFFDLVETGSPEGPCKPEGIRAVLDRFLLKPEEAIYVGDTASDVASARSAGVPAVAAPGRKPPTGKPCAGPARTSCSRPSRPSGSGSKIPSAADPGRDPEAEPGGYFR